MRTTTVAPISNSSHHRRHRRAGSFNKPSFEITARALSLNQPALCDTFRKKNNYTHFADNALNAALCVRLYECVDPRLKTPSARVRARRRTFLPPSFCVRLYAKVSVKFKPSARDGACVCAQQAAAAADGTLVIALRCCNCHFGICFEAQRAAGVTFVTQGNATVCYTRGVG